MKKLSWMFAVLAVAACGGSSSGGVDQASSSGGSSGGSSGSGIPRGPGVFDGTWDVVITNPNTGRESTGTITISPSLFAMAFNDFQLNGAVNAGVPDITFNRNGSGTQKLGTTLAQSTFDTGGLSYPIGGEWVFKGESGEGCTANIKIPTMSLECDGTPSDIRRGIEGTSSAQRVSSIASSFGELGGEWTVLVPDATCEAKIVGTELTASCSESGTKKGSLTMKVDGDTASGGFEDGLEISAKRQ